MMFWITQPICWIALVSYICTESVLHVLVIFLCGKWTKLFSATKAALYRYSENCVLLPVPTQISSHVIYMHDSLMLLPPPSFELLMPSTIDQTFKAIPRRYLFTTHWSFETIICQHWRHVGKWLHLNVAQPQRTASTQGCLENIMPMMRLLMRGYKTKGFWLSTSSYLHYSARRLLGDHARPHFSLRLSSLIRPTTAMPSLLISTLAGRTAITNLPRSSTATNATVDALQVICAFPVSGQYGPGSRVLYVNWFSSHFIGAPLVSGRKKSFKSLFYSS
jgi:hypothetical protein